MSLKLIEEAVDGNHILLGAIAAGVAALAGKKIYSNYKKRKNLKKIGVNSKSREAGDINDIIDVDYLSRELPQLLKEKR